MVDSGDAQADRPRRARDRPQRARPLPRHQERRTTSAPSRRATLRNVARHRALLPRRLARDAVGRHGPLQQGRRAQPVPRRRHPARSGSARRRSTIWCAFMASLTGERYAALGKKELARQRALSRTKRPQRDVAAALGKKAQTGLVGPVRRSRAAADAARPGDDWRPLMARKHKSIETKYMEARDEAFARSRALDRRTFLKVAAASAGAVLAQGPVAAALVPAGERRLRRAGGAAGVLVRVHLGHAPVRARSSTIASCARRSRRSTTSTRSIAAAGLRALRRRPGAARQARGARARRADPEGGEGAAEDDGRRARLVPRHGRAAGARCSARRATRSITRACTSSCS